MADLFLPTPEQMRDQMLEDLELAAIDAGVDAPPIEAGSDWYALATAEGGLHAISCQNVALAQRDVTPLEAQEPKLDEWRQALGLPVIATTAARGKIIVETTGSATISNGRVLTHKTGARYAVNGTFTGVANNDEIDVLCLDQGEAGNREPGDVLTWASAPTNVKSTATVSTEDPVVGGTDSETPERKRDRILNRAATAPGGGNWGQLRETAISASPIIQDAYVYPALGGPGSAKVVLTRRFDPVRRVFTRAPSSTVRELVRAAIHALEADMLAVVVQSVADENVDASLVIDIPDSVLAGGNGQGWLDASPWPSLNGDTRVTVSAVTDERTITVNGLTTTAPVAGQTRIAWWSPTDLKFVTRLVVSQSGIAGAWVLGLDQPLASSDGTIVSVGDYISPAAVNIQAYGDTWRTLLEDLGPGENTGSSSRLPRAARHPLTTSEDSPNLTTAQLRALGNAHLEILDVAYSYRSLTGPTVPAAIATAPNVLVPRHFGVYPL